MQLSYLNHKILFLLAIFIGCDQKLKIDKKKYKVFQFRLIFLFFNLSSQEIHKMFPCCSLRHIPLSWEFVFDLLFVSYSPSALQQLCSV